MSFATGMPPSHTHKKPLSPELQAALIVVGHEHLCLSCWMNVIAPYLLEKLDSLRFKLFWWIIFS